MMAVFREEIIFDIISLRQFPIIAGFMSSSYTVTTEQQSRFASRIAVIRGDGGVLRNGLVIPKRGRPDTSAWLRCLGSTEIARGTKAATITGSVIYFFMDGGKNIK